MSEINFKVGQKPPNWETLVRCFRVKWGKVVVTYGNNIYSQNPISPDLVVHESTHVKQQGNSPEVWWDEYVISPMFRLEQELEAYKAQMKFIKRGSKDRNYLFRIRSKLSRDLSGGMYGKIISFSDAYKELM